MPWLKLSTAHWPEVAEALPKPWPAWARLMDLDWHRWTGQQRPTIRLLASRWGVGRGTAERSISEWDKSGTRVGQEWDRINGQTPEVAPVVGQEWDKSGTRVGHPNIEEKENREEYKKAPPEPIPALVLEALEASSIRPPAPGTALATSVLARVAEHGAEAVALVVRWRAESPQERARFLRDGGYGLDTLMRPRKFGGYLDAARAWRPSEAPRVELAIPWSEVDRVAREAYAADRRGEPWSCALDSPMAVRYVRRYVERGGAWWPDARQTWEARDGR